MLPIYLPIANSVLASLPRVEYLRLLPSLEPVHLAEGDLLCEAGMPLAYVYFPGDCLVSLLTLVDGGQVFAVALVGREGMTSVATALGAQRSPFRALVQASGNALRMPSAAFVAEFRTSAALRAVVLAYVLSLTEQISQTAACNRFHGIEARLARWLLMTRDRLSLDHFHMTHDMLGHLLGVRRVGVTHAAHGLKLRGLIDYSRGAITITDGSGLRAAACSCYRMLDSRHGAAGPVLPPLPARAA
ncbi:MAG: Crp/Fnr family transcriptional regulator [Rhodoferax sp.]|nr:Crp/Fnr family transcriptional regulator [Rhodoferax sp.]